MKNEMVVGKIALAKRSKILEFENIMSKFPDVKKGDMNECPLKHTFAEGVYVREIFLPKGSVVIGKIHRHTHPNFLMSGKVKVVTESEGTEILTAPLSMISPAGTKRIVHALEDTVWITVHVTESTDVQEIEKEVIAESYDELYKNVIECNTEGGIL